MKSIDDSKTFEIEHRMSGEDEIGLSFNESGISQQISREANSVNENLTLKEAIRYLRDTYFVSEKSSPLDALLSNNFTNIYESEGSREIKDHLVEIEGTYSDKLRDKGIITIQSNKGTDDYALTVRETIHSSLAADSLNNGDRLSIIAIAVSDYNLSVAVTVIKGQEKHLFERIIPLYGRSCAIKDYFRLFGMSEGKQQYIHDMLSDKQKYTPYEKTKDMHFNTKEEQLLLYTLTKECYPYENQRARETIWNDADPIKHKSTQKIRYLSNISPSNKDRSSYLSVQFLEELFDSRIYGLSDAKQQLIDLIISSEHAKKRRGFNVLLVGGSGVGKTALMEAVAAALNLPFETIPLGAMSCPQELDGLDSGYDNADVGRLIKIFSGHGSSEMVIGLDQIDMVNRLSKEGDSLSVLCRSLSGLHEDKFLGCPVPTENTVFIATAYSIEKIPEPLLSRFQSIIEIPDYSIKEKVYIAQNHLIPQILNKYGISAERLSFSNSVIEYIAKNYCSDGGVRDMAHAIEKVVCRFMCEGGENGANYATKKRVETILSSQIKETDALFFRRHESEYTEPVKNAIKDCLTNINNSSINPSLGLNTENEREKLECLLSCRSGKSPVNGGFNPKTFSELLHKNVFGMNTAINEITLFYHTALMQDSANNSNLALVGSFGTGKTTIAKHIAEAMGYHFVKLSLNGVADSRELRGFYGSQPGLVTKAIKNAGSLRTVILLDEIDKMTPALSNALIDLLDREFFDGFLSVPIRLENTIFIATANDWHEVPYIIRDRFAVVNVEGYTHREKAHIISDYIIPNLERKYKQKVNISIEKKARDYLLQNYCTSFGVRDAERAIQKIVSSKLLNQLGSKNPNSVHIKESDIGYLGKEPILRGNFPEIKPGIAKALAVDGGDHGNAFAIETVLIDGDGPMEITGLPQESLAESAKLAATCIKKLCPQLLLGKQINIHLGEGSIPKEGSSAGVALFMSIFSAGIERELMVQKPYDVAFTGELSLTGGIFKVGGLYEKIQAACDSGAIKVFIPTQNYDRLEKEKIAQYPCEIISVGHIKEVINALFPFYDI